LNFWNLTYSPSGFALFDVDINANVFSEDFFSAEKHIIIFLIMDDSDILCLHNHATWFMWKKNERESSYACITWFFFRDLLTGLF